jgi:hypothetical protein
MMGRKAMCEFRKELIVMDDKETVWMDRAPLPRWKAREPQLNHEDEGEVRLWTKS